MPSVLGLDPSAESERIEAAIERLDGYLASLPRAEAGAPLVALLGSIRWVIALRFGCAPASLDEAQRETLTHMLFDDDESLLTRLAERARRPFADRWPSLRSIAKGLRSILALAYYTNPDTDAFTGYEPIWERPHILEAAPEIQAPSSSIDVGAIASKRLEGADLEGARVFANDGRPRVAVIGSGAGGAVIAAHLAGRYDVAVFEAGPSFQPHEYPLDALAGMSLLFDDGMQTLSRNMDLHLLRGRLVGGSTVLSSGMSVRPRSRTLGHWQQLGIDLPSMNSALSEVEKRLRIAPVAESCTSDPGRWWRQGGERLHEDLVFDVPLANVATHPDQHLGNPRANVDRRGSSCLRCGLCNYGCRFGHKLSMDLTYLLDVKAAGGRVHPNLGVDRLIAGVDPATGLTRVVGLQLARGGAPIAVDHVVLAAGAVGSAALLLRSIEGGGALASIAARPHVGKGLGFNYGSTVIARWKKAPERPGDSGIQISFIASRSSDETFVLENAFIPPGLMAGVVPGIGKDHREWMRRYRHLGMACNTIGSPQTGEIDARSRVTYRVGEGEMTAIHETLALTVRMYLRSGAECVGLSGMRSVDDRSNWFYPGEERDPRALLDKVRRVAADPSRIMLASAHPQGGLRFGRTPSAGAVGEDFRVHGVQNLFVGDASLFPSTIVVNPQWTVMALARVAAGQVVRVIERGRAERIARRAAVQLGTIAPV